MGILLVEDDGIIQTDLAELLRDEGYDVVTAFDGRQALDRLRREPQPCVILLDLMMPVMDGWTFRAEQLKHPDLARIPVVVLSGVGDLGQDDQVLSDTTWVSKPIDVDRLLAAVEVHCGA